MEKHCAARQLEIKFLNIYYLILSPEPCSNTPFPTTLACSFFQTFPSTPLPKRRIKMPENFQSSKFSVPPPTRNK